MRARVASRLAQQAGPEGQEAAQVDDAICEPPRATLFCSPDASDFPHPGSARQATQSTPEHAMYVAGVVRVSGGRGAGGNRRLAVALVSFRCLTCLFDGCLTIV